MLNSRQKKEEGVKLTVAHHAYNKGMNNYANYKVHNNKDGQDLVSSTFLKTWSYIINGGKIHLMKPFLYHILNQLIIDEYRKHKTVSLDVLLAKGFEPSFDHSERIANIHDGEIARLLIKELPLKYERVMRMRYVQELSLKEIAVITGQSRNTVGVQAYRGLARLRVLYKNKQK